MKTNRKSKAFLALLLTVVMALPLLCGTFVRAWADGKDPSVRVTARMEEGKERLEEAGAVYDLYLLATTESEGIYTFLEGLQPEAWPEGPEGPDAQNAWNAMAQEAAEKCVGEKTPVVSGAPLEQSVKENAAGESLQAGLYLLITRPDEVDAEARGADYLKEFEDEDGNTYLASELLTWEWAVKVAPQIIALPTKEADENGVIRTDGPGDWIYDVEVTLKPEYERRLGSIEIVKDLLSYETSHEAFFVFQIEGTVDGENVYSNLVSMRFDGAGEQRRLVENIPVGADVTVTEIYSTPGYSIVGADSGTITVLPDEVVSIRFENDWDENRNKGGGVMNTFDYDPERGENGEWAWTQE